MGRWHRAWTAEEDRGIGAEERIPSQFVEKSTWHLVVRDVCSVVEGFLWLLKGNARSCSYRYLSPLGPPEPGT